MTIQIDMSDRRVLVIDDDEVARAFASAVLRSEGADVDACGDSRTALEYLDVYRYDAVVLDLNMQSEDGASLIPAIRARQGTAVVTHSACDASAFAVMALKSGSDEYCTKPMTARELALRVEMAIERRCDPEAEVVAADDRPSRRRLGGAVIFHDRLILDPYCRIAIANGVELDLTDAEFDLLVTFAASPGRVFSAHELREETWPSDVERPGLETVDELVSQLRRMIDPPSPGRSWIQTVPGAGYRFDRRRQPQGEAALEENIHGVASLR